MVGEDFFSEGQMFYGSSVAGWKAINESDMLLMPDQATAIVDPFFQQPTLAVMCDVLDPISGQPYNRDPRTTAKKAEAYVKASGVGDTVFGADGRNTRPAGKQALRAHRMVVGDNRRISFCRLFGGKDNAGGAAEFLHGDTATEAAADV